MVPLSIALTIATSATAQTPTQTPTQAATQTPTQAATQTPTQAATQTPTQAATQTDVFDRRAGAWDRSVALERAGQVDKAREELLLAWGPTPEGYEVTVRLAWLSLQLGDSERAVAGYERARKLPGAGPEATQGLASAHTQRGFASLEKEQRASAREDFQTAITLDAGQKDAVRGLELAGPASRVDPELWFAVLNQSIREDKWWGGAVFAHVPWQLNENWRLRLAYRYIRTQAESQVSPPSTPRGRPSQSSGRTVSSNQNEIFAGVRYGSRWTDLEVLGIAVFPPDEQAVLGGGFQLRAGSRFGALIEGAAMDRESGWNHQIVPGLYVWPANSVGLAAGLRYTSDGTGQDTSGWAGLSLVSQRTEFHLRGHVGTERWAFSSYQPTILTINPDTTAGGNASLLVPLSPTWQLGIQADAERLRLGEDSGIYFSAGLGLRWSPSQRGSHR